MKCGACWPLFPVLCTLAHWKPRTRTQAPQSSTLQNYFHSSLSAQCDKQEVAFADAEQHGEMSLGDARSKLEGPEDALQKAKHGQDMAWQVKGHQDILTIKLPWMWKLPPTGS